MRLVLASLLLAATPAAAWGPVGHRAVGQIAEERLGEKAQQAVRGLLRDESLAEVALWADQIRSESRWRISSPWHYVNIPDGQTYDRTRRSRDGDVVGALERFVAVLRYDGSSREDKLAALKFIAHFVGDLHQPLHVGRASDRGGNEVHVSWFGKSSNLHRVWDSALISRLRLSPKSLVRTLESRSPEEVEAWRRDSPMTWVDESMALRPLVYNMRGRGLGRAYLREAGPVVEERLLQAGVRLAALLDAIFE
ncbi:MAG: S1/P1 nuclease [Acidobacteria bacterium]|nr:S1/P1 nuclease [Acidobacteriota bacterium]MDA1235372.1 S1/P1 nuclease [Acidobacteriota bacterium]